MNEKKQQVETTKAQVEEDSKKADEEMKAAIPLLEQAENALKDIDVKDVQFLKSLPSPPAPVVAVCRCLQIFRPYEREDESEGWAGAKIMLGDPKNLIDRLQKYKDRIGSVKQSSIDKINKI